ncbi:MAG: histidine--tRNA ligase [Gammaproteobacteria bacterium]|nr:histidine--tRNA ligase [Gammaproteobacteria bacterium]
MVARYQRVRGMRDVLPGESERWREVEGAVIDVLGRYGFRELRLPLVEATDLFTRGVGEATDLVEKEMYTFDDRKGKSLSLRPEGTAGCVRACIENGLLHNQTPRLWYHGPMFRYERPQKGRTRQHTQIGGEVFGVSSPEIDAEIMTMLCRVFRELGVSSAVTLELNSLGSGSSRDRYREALVDYLSPHRDELDVDSRRRLGTNPLRILDSKVPTTRAIVRDAPAPVDYLGAESQRHFDGLRRLLDQAGVGYRVNPHLVRGLDYYTDTVFEWVTEALGAQGAVCSGGRYDGLVERLGHRPVPGAGFGMGLERVVLLHEACNERDYSRADVYMVADPEHAARAARVAERLRDGTPLRVLQHAGVGGLASQLRQADRSGARWAVIVGDDEVAQNRVSLKWLREGPQMGRGEQTMLTAAELISTLQGTG